MLAFVSILTVLGSLVGLFLLIFKKGRRRLGALLFVGGCFASTLITSLQKHERPYEASSSEPRAAVSAGASSAIEASAEPGRTPEVEILRAYCDMYARYLISLKEADKRFGVEGSAKKLAWVKAQDAVHYADFEKVVGATSSQWQAAAIEQEWDQQCEAPNRSSHDRQAPQ